MLRFVIISYIFLFFVCLEILKNSDYDKLCITFQKFAFIENRFQGHL